MGVNAIRSESVSSTPRTTASREPTPAVQSKFEEAVDKQLKRKSEKEEQPGTGAQTGAHGSQVSAQAADALTPRGRQKGDDAMAMGGEGRGPQSHAAAAPDAPAPASVRGGMPDASFADFQALLQLPNQPVATAETRLVMPDTRWIASEAVLTREADGALTVDIDARSDQEAEEQRESLKARLEARGHRVSAIRIT